MDIIAVDFPDFDIRKFITGISGILIFNPSANLCIFFAEITDDKVIIRNQKHTPSGYETDIVQYFFKESPGYSSRNISKPAIVPEEHRFHFSPIIYKDIT